MGSSCSSRQDTASIQSEEESRNEDAENPIPVDKKEESYPAGERARMKDKVALRFIDNDFSSCGDEGATADTPLSSTVSAVAVNGSTKGKPPEKNGKDTEELPDLSLLTEESRLIIEGNVIEGKCRIGNKICVIFLGRLDDDGKKTKEMMNRLNRELSARFDSKGIEIVLLNIHGGLSLPKAPVSPSEMIADYIKDQRGMSSVIVVLLRGTNAELFELPTRLTNSEFSHIANVLTENKEKDILHKLFIQDGSNYILRRDFEGLLSEKKEEYEKGYELWRHEYNSLMTALAKTGVGDEPTKFRLKSTLEVDLEWIKDLNSEIPLKVILVRKDAKKTPVEDKMEQFLQNIQAVEDVRERANVIFEGRASGFDIFCPKISKDEGTGDWWNEIFSLAKSVVEDCIVATSSPPGNKVNPLEDRLKTTLIEELSGHCALTLHNCLEQSIGHEKHLNQIQKYLNEPTKQALLVVGPTGSGKTYLTSAASRQCIQWKSEAIVMTRYINLTNNCGNVEGLLYYLMEQAVISHGHYPAYKSTDIFDHLKALWRKATSSRPIIIFLDAVDQLHCGDESWQDLISLFAELPEYVKVVLTADEQSKFREQYAKKVSNDELILKLGTPEEKESEELMKCFLHRNRQELSSETWDNVKKSTHCSLAPVYLVILSQLLLAAGSCSESCDGTSSLEELMNSFIRKLGTLFPAALLESVLGCLSLTRIGLMESEVLSIIKSTPCSSSENSIIDWLYLRLYLKPFMRVRREGGFVMLSFPSPIRELIAKSFLGTEEKYRSCFELFRNTVFIKEENRIFNISLPEEHKKSLSHVRALQDSMLNLARSTKEIDTLFNLDWLFKMVEAGGPFKVLDEIDLALEKTAAHDRELSILREVVQLSSSSLVYDSSQFFSQVYGRLKWRLSKEENYTRLSALLASASKSPLPCLLPLSSCLASVQKNKPLSVEDKTTYLNSIFRIPGNPNHVIAISTNRSQVTVWNIFTMETVRTLNGINQPRKLEMIDDYKCILLCGRELRIYNLNEGTFLMKLREVMNQKMPFFGLHDSDHVVALSRSRMYVNMMNLTQGNCVTTFKVGEDRFLNSLLVSENGKICVCGDDSQKPSALLVWDLQLRKLMYDLRIPHHEFATRLAAITIEGHYVCCVCREVDEPAPNFIVVYDLQSGTLFKRWKPEVNTISISISTAGTCVIVGLEDSSIMAFDLITGNRRWTVHGHCSPPDTFRLDQQGLVLLSYDSLGKDQSLRVWDVHTGKNLATFTPDQRISACEITLDGKAVVLALEGSNVIHTFLLLHQEDPAEVVEKPTSYGDQEHHGKVVDFSQT